ncbi:chlorohydrolase [Streptococcus pneumoniae]|nr:chlorohydrolase [Streptococcus pneumoniae]
MKIKEQTRKLAAGCSKHCFEVVDTKSAQNTCFKVVDGTDEVSSKHCFEVVDNQQNISLKSITVYIFGKNQLLLG